MTTGTQTVRELTLAEAARIMREAYARAEHDDWDAR